MKVALFLAPAVILAIIAGCSPGDITSPNQIVFPAKNVSFKAQVQPYLTLACNNPGCHDVGTQSGGVDLSSYISIINTPNLAIPHDTTSLLVQVLDAGTYHPVGQIIANDNQRAGIRQWILEGALDN